MSIQCNELYTAHTSTLRCHTLHPPLLHRLQSVSLCLSQRLVGPARALRQFDMAPICCRDLDQHPLWIDLLPTTLASFLLLIMVIVACACCSKDGKKREEHPTKTDQRRRPLSPTQAISIPIERERLSSTDTLAHESSGLSGSKSRSDELPSDQESQDEIWVKKADVAASLRLDSVKEEVSLGFLAPPTRLIFFAHISDARRIRHRGFDFDIGAFFEGTRRNATYAEEYAKFERKRGRVDIVATAAARFEDCKTDQSDREVETEAEIQAKTESKTEAESKGENEGESERSESKIDRSEIAEEKARRVREESEDCGAACESGDSSQ